MAQTFEFLFILPDGPSAAEFRDSTTDPHEDYVRETIGYWRGGGPIFTEHSKPGEPPQFAGSWVLLEAGSKEEALEILKKDPFTTGKVWDWTKAQILSVKSGLRVGLEKSRFHKS
ncbi:YCII-related domain protein [Xylogone sp. PMI_703]|nr:YCII-related domain protein [Xylogone sp. PMI_703]